MKKILFVFLAILILFISSCEDSDIPAMNELDFTVNNITAEPQTFPAMETEVIWEEDDMSGELIYNAFYTVDDVVNMFNEDKELFEQIKNLKMPDGYDYFMARNEPCEIEFYNFSNDIIAKNPVSYNIDENSEYKIIYDFFSKYEYIYFIHSIDPDNKIYADENIIVLFKLQMNLPGLEANYIPWGEIRYNRNGGEIEENATGKYIVVLLDEHWYFIYGNIYPLS